VVTTNRVEGVLTTKRLVCLANSRKLNGRCVAGRQIDAENPGPWIRPVSSREHQEVSEYERHYEDGRDPQVLDILEVTLQRPSPRTYQTENWLLDPTSYWVRSGRLSWDDLQAFVEPDGPLWPNGRSTYHGANDTIPVLEADLLDTSLRLINAAHVDLVVFAPSEAFGNSKRRVQASFEHAGTDYRFWVTDPVCERKYLALPNGEHQLGECCLTVSLGEPFNGNCNKLVAAVIPALLEPGRNT
jgi:hypothetical protein